MLWDIRYALRTFARQPSFVCATLMTLALGIARMALGADARGIRALILRDGGRLIARGLLLGGACALPVAPLLGRLLFGVSAFDPMTITIVPIVLAAAALGARYLPAHRASRLEPLDVLRME